MHTTSVAVSTQSKFEQESDKRVYLRGHSEHSIFNSTLNNLVSVISSNAKDPAQGLSIRLCEIPLYARDDTTIPQHSTLNQPCHCQGVYVNHYTAITTDNQRKSYIKVHFCQGVSPTPWQKTRRDATHVASLHSYSYKLNYSAFASSAAGASVAGASTAGAAAALFLERRVRVAFLAVLAMFSL